jgi:hypothetical protein
LADGRRTQSASLRKKPPSPACATGHRPKTHFVLASRLAGIYSRAPGHDPIVLTSRGRDEALLAPDGAVTSSWRKVALLNGETNAQVKGKRCLESDRHDRHSWAS